MSRGKHSRSSSSNAIQNKKRKVTTDGSSSVIGTCFEKLSNELIYEVFEFLDFYDVYRAFYSLNMRFRQIITNSTLPIHVNLSSRSKSTFESYNKDCILPNKHRIQSLHLSNPCLYDHTASPTHILSQFLHLQTLILNNIEVKHLAILMPTLTSLFYLSSLSIDPIDNEPIMNAIYPHVFRLSALKYLRLSNKNLSCHDSLPVSSNEQSPIEYLVINETISFDLLIFLLSHLPQLRRLSAHIRVLYTLLPNQIKAPSLKSNYLTHVSLGLKSITFDQFEQLMINVFPLVEILYISIPPNTDSVFTDATRWQQLISSHLPQLRIFDFLHDNWPNNGASNSNSHQFSSLFWSKRQWFFVEQHYKEKYLFRTIFYSTNPYRRREYTLGDEKHDITDSNVQIRPVQHLHIVDEKNIKDHQYFPNVTTLTLGNGFTTTVASVAATLSRVVPLKNLTHLHLECTHFSLAKVMELFRFTPHVHTLTLSSLSSYGLDSESMQQNRAFQFIHCTNIVANLTLKGVCSMDQLQILLTLFPRMKQLHICIYAKCLHSFIRHILQKVKEKANRHLCLLSFRSAAKVWMERTKSLIDSKRLLNDYVLKFVVKDLYLWW
ncbi:unnamed protein product [Adineta ricciae]|uniref:F-box domain-containing protein n=1 Tax=Adineta ricciae TaxID=249248 RepID=A0A815DF68_ADIRI|nr:unnamed protein product [Adineta ricciae]